MKMQNILNLFNEAATIWVVIPSVIVLGLYFSLRLRFLQISKLFLSAKCLLRNNQKEQGDISHYQALSAVIAGNLGTGNISGVAVALSTGGPGALVWMWIMALFGAMIQYASCVLGVKYRKRDPDSGYVGGPMYYLRDGLNLKKTGVLFAAAAMMASITVGSFAQINSIVLPLAKMGIHPFGVGVALAFLVAIVILGGVTRLAKVSSSIVPIMALVYLVSASIVLALHANKIPGALQQIFVSAFSLQPAAGGALGFGVFKALTVGFKRGVFATDAGTGIVPILQASAKTKSPIADGLVTLIAPFIVMIMCTTTGLILMVSGASNIAGLQSTNMVTHAFSKVFGEKLGSSIVISSLFLFAYTTMIAWGCCGERAAAFLFGRKNSRYFLYVYLLLVPVGALCQVDLVWMLADISISFMLITNLIGITGLSREVIYDTKEYFAKADRVIL